MIIRRAEDKDKESIIKILKEVDEYSESLSLDSFWVAEENNSIVAVMKLKEIDDFFFLSSLAVRINLQGKGIARQLLEEVLKKADKDIYLYTVLPEFFSRFGFKKVEQTAKLPSKSKLECERCYPEKCETMLRSAHDS